VAFGSVTTPAKVVFSRRNRKPSAQLRYDLQLAPGERIDLEFLVACDHQNGHEGALHVFRRLAGRGQNLLERKRERYTGAACAGVQLHTPDEQVNNDWVLAKANLHMLQADYEPNMPSYFLAGIPEYPNLFGCDNTYTTPGATAAGFAPTMRDTLSLLGEYARRACGRVPHEVTTNGRVFNPGNTQETPQFAIAVWDYVRWTGDMAFLRMMYPLCREGVISYLPSVWGGGNDGYPMGDAMVERTGMGSRKLDSACYLFGAWQALAAMAALLERPEAAEYNTRLHDWRERFERDWWMPQQGMYADSLHTDGRPQLDGHWTQVVPIQLGIAQPDRAEQVLDQIEREFTNQWGLVHTRGKEDRVWTLPTGLLALAAARHNRSDYALRMLQNIAGTARTGMLGAFKELIPEGLCFVQLWSAGLYLQGILEGLLGLEPHAHAHRLNIAPKLPSTWTSVTLRDLRVGTHRLDLEIAPTTLRVEHISGPQPIAIGFRPAGASVAALDDPATMDIRSDSTMANGTTTATLRAGETATITVQNGVAHVQFDQASDAAVAS
jgi:glycogen debranching enzyme